MTLEKAHELGFDCYGATLLCEAVKLASKFEGLGYTVEIIPVTMASKQFTVHFVAVKRAMKAGNHATRVAEGFARRGLTT